MKYKLHFVDYLPVEEEEIFDNLNDLFYYMRCLSKFQREHATLTIVEGRKTVKALLKEIWSLAGPYERIMGILILGMLIAWPIAYWSM